MVMQLFSVSTGLLWLNVWLNILIFMKNISASAWRRMGDQGIGADKHFTANSHQDPFSASFERRRFSARFRFCQR